MTVAIADYGPDFPEDEGGLGFVVANKVEVMAEFSFHYINGVDVVGRIVGLVAIGRDLVVVLGHSSNVAAFIECVPEGLTMIP